MNEYVAIQNLPAVLNLTRLIPSVTMWNRLEGRPRTLNFDRALKAEIRDPLWMLCKQWQMGEFRGDDAGSPIFAKVHMSTTGLSKYQANDKAVQEFEKDVPLEAKVEQQKIPFTVGTQKISLDLRLMMGRQWLKMLDKERIQSGVIGDYKSEYIEKYPVEAPAKYDEADVQVCAHQEVMQQFVAMAGRSMDGAALYFDLKGDPTAHAYDKLDAVLDSAQQSRIDDLAAKFTAWFEKLFYQPEEEDNNAWMPSALEYRFSCSAPQGSEEKVLYAEEYYHGHLDWYNVDIDASESALSPDVNPPDLEDAFTYSFLPAPITFDGMPHTRWWKFEDWKTSFGDIKPDTTDINKLLLMEFGLVYANDWFIVPFTLPLGSVAHVKGIAVTNVFGERTWIEAAGTGPANSWQNWNMYTLSVKGEDKLDDDKSLLLLPTVPKIQEGKPMERIYMVRDEMANMVWGLESLVPLADGTSKPGKEAAIELYNEYKKIFLKQADDGSVVPESRDYKADIRYQIMNSVPENWIPFIPVKLNGSSRQIQLQRASMPRIIEGDPNDPKKVKPRTPLLRQGLDRSSPEAYYIHEEEIPRSGISIERSFQRTRWTNGRVFNWLGIRKETGRGEGSSGLAFDQVIEVK